MKTEWWRILAVLQISADDQLNRNIGVGALMPFTQFAKNARFRHFTLLERFRVVAPYQPQALCKIARSHLLR